MSLQFVRGDSRTPVGHALIYFRADDTTIVATYVTVPPIKFEIGKYMPPFLATAMQGMDLGEAMVAQPFPPMPEEVPGEEYLKSLAERRRDDLVFGGSVNRTDPMRLAAETAEAARAYGELYEAGEEPTQIKPTPMTADIGRFEAMTQPEQLNEFGRLVGRLFDSLRNGSSDEDIERQLRQLAGILPAKYRAQELVDAIAQRGVTAQRLAELYIDRAYKLFNEDYLELERIDREIEAAHE